MKLAVSSLPSPFPPLPSPLRLLAMLQAASILVLSIACLLASGGCQWAGLRDPVPASLAASRRLSSEGNELMEQKQPEKAEEKLAEAVKVCPRIATPDDTMPKPSGSATRGRKPWPNSKRPADSVRTAICGSVWARCAWKWAAWTRHAHCADQALEQ